MRPHFGAHHRHPSPAREIGNALRALYAPAPAPGFANDLLAMLDRTWPSAGAPPFAGGR